MISRNVLFAIGFGALLAACGGGGDPGPTPLAHHFDDMYIAQVPLEEKQAVITTQNDYSVAKMERAKAEADLNDAGVQLDIARNERQQASLDEKSANTRKKAAEDSGDQNRVNTATREVRAAELSRKAADQKVAYLEAHRRYLKKQLRYTEENLYATEAKFEQAKSRLAKAKNIRPKNFDPGVYDRQAEDRARRTQRARQVAADEKAKAETKKKQWQGMVKEAERLGAPKTSPSPADAGGGAAGGTTDNGTDGAGNGGAEGGASTTP